MRYLILSGAFLWAQSDIDALWAERDNPNTAKEAARLIEQSLSQNPHQPTQVVRLTRIYYLLGEQSDEKATRLEYYDKAFKLCRNELAHQLGLSATVKDEEIVKKAQKDHLPLLYWAAASLARWGKHAPFAQKVQARSTIRLYWDKVMELEPAYFHGGGYRFFGGYYALVPAITGDQDVNKSREMFDKSLSTAPYYLETKVLYAEAYAAHPKVRNKELFQRLLKEVLNADPGKDPDYAPENRLAQKKARDLLAREAELFEND
ncbi:MAG: TRAP transporter TatT component family protein [Bacteroidia bacterium]|nr:TRAP transporter TatT component family protein [Bacteroidia bacterium]MCX7651401.1 TRAP transporter TatT component family protein [Bacteroidia bacterium]MDW8416699.1 TRAP transporter TatT component family protein [Bacteroidia bacterium]